jgi:hypothetical protein
MKLPLLLVLCTSLVCSVPAVAATSVEQRLQVLEAKESIRTLLFDYGRLLDARDWQGFSELFAENGGTWNGGMGVAKGRAAIKKMMVDTIGSTNAGANGALTNLHLLGNEIIDVKGDTASSISKWAFVMTDKVQGPVIMYIGRYQDTFVREKGQWKFQERKALSDISRPGQLPPLKEDAAPAAKP